jgi:hypothetical protein
MVGGGDEVGMMNYETRTVINTTYSLRTVRVSRHISQTNNQVNNKIRLSVTIQTIITIIHVTISKAVASLHAQGALTYSILSPHTM